MKEIAYEKKERQNCIEKMERNRAENKDRQIKKEKASKRERERVKIGREQNKNSGSQIKIVKNKVWATDT